MLHFGVVCFSSSSTHPEVTPEVREDHIGDDLAKVAVMTVVAPGTESTDRPHPTPGPVLLLVNSHLGGQIPGPAIPPASSGSKATFKLRPALPKYTVTFGVTIVLDYLKMLLANPQLSLKMLTY